MNKRIQKKKMTQKRNASRKLILSMDDDFDKYDMLIRHAILFDDYKFVREVIGPESHYLVIPRMIGKRLFYRWMLSYLDKEYKL